jgi:hypothetical protein
VDFEEGTIQNNREMKTFVSILDATFCFDLSSFLDPFLKKDQLPTIAASFSSSLLIVHAFL